MAAHFLGLPAYEPDVPKAEKAGRNADSRCTSEVTGGGARADIPAAGGEFMGVGSSVCAAWMGWGGLGGLGWGWEG